VPFLRPSRGGRPGELEQSPTAFKPLLGRFDDLGTPSARIFCTLFETRLSVRKSDVLRPRRCVFCHLPGQFITEQRARIGDIRAIAGRLVCGRELRLLRKRSVGRACPRCDVNCTGEGIRGALTWRRQRSQDHRRPTLWQLPLPVLGCYYRLPPFPSQSVRRPSLLSRCLALGFVL
jgi:hypothetical protein